MPLAQAEINKLLNQESPPEEIQELLSDTNQLLELSRSTMQEFFDQWDTNAEVYKGEMSPDRDDVEASEAGDPIKMVVPMSYAQVETFKAFAHNLYNQNPLFFELEPTGDEDYLVRDDAERTLDRDLRRNVWSVCLDKFLLDVGRFGVGVVKHMWDQETTNIYVTESAPDIPVPGSDTTVRGEVSSGYQEVTKYEGNKLLNISPYNFLPDTRLPLSRFQEGEFCASEEEFHKFKLNKLQSAGKVGGVQFIEDFKLQHLQNRGDTRLPNLSQALFNGQGNAELDLVCLTEVQRVLVPKDYGLGDEDFQMKWLLWIANDHRIVRAEPLGYLHDDFTYDLGLFNPDEHEELANSLADVIHHLQNVITWFFNSHIESVSRVIENRYVVDPTGVEMESLEDRSAFILLRSSVARGGVDRYIKQMPQTDVTARHPQDAQILVQMMQMVTGVNENAMGQFAPGRRSATEARAVTAGAASRLRTVATNLWSMALAPLGRKMLINQRQEMSRETFFKIIGTESDITPEQLEARYTAFKSTPQELIANEDFFVFDSTLPSEKGFLAQMVQEMFALVMQFPQAATAFDIDPKALFSESFRLRGLHNLSRFSLQKRLQQQSSEGNLLEQQQLAQLLTPQNGPTQPGGSGP